MALHPQSHLTKSQLRQTLKRQREELNPEAKSVMDYTVAQQTIKLIESIQNNKTIGLYRALPHEIATSFIDHTLHANHTLIYPRINSEDNRLTFHSVDINKPDDWEMGTFGILQPLTVLPALRADIYIVPLLGFNTQGYRIGYGQGHYDRYFAELDMQPITIGMAYDWQQVNTSFQESFDYPLNFIVTYQNVFVIDS